MTNEWKIVFHVDRLRFLRDRIGDDIQRVPFRQDAREAATFERRTVLPFDPIMNEVASDPGRGEKTSEDQRDASRFPFPSAKELEHGWGPQLEKRLGENGFATIAQMTSLSAQTTDGSRNDSTKKTQVALSVPRQVSRIANSFVFQLQLTIQSPSITF